MHMVCMVRKKWKNSQYENSSLYTFVDKYDYPAQDKALMTMTHQDIRRRLELRT